MYGMDTIDTACSFLGSEHPVSVALRALRSSVGHLSLQVDDIFWNATRGNARTWTDVMNRIGRQTAPSRIFIDQQIGDPPLVIPANAIPGDRYDLRWSSFLSSQFGDPTFNLIQGAAGARLANIGPLSGSVALVGGTDGFLENAPLGPSSPPIYVATLGAYQGINGPNGSANILVPDNGFAVLALEGGGAISLNPLASVVRLGANATLLLIAINGTGGFDANVLAGDASGVLILEHDGQLPFPLPPFPLFAGTELNAPLGEVGGAGPTSFRPITFNNPVAVGCRYWDTSLATPQNVYWTGTTWVDYANVPT